jgi:hypothetical protein
MKQKAKRSFITKSRKYENTKSRYPGPKGPALIIPYKGLQLNPKSEYRNSKQIQISKALRLQT